MEDFALLIGGGIAIVAVMIAGVWLNIKIKPKGPARGKAAATGKKKTKAKKAGKFFQDKGQVLDEKGNVLEDSNLYKMKEGRDGVYKDDDGDGDGGKIESWEKYG